MFPSSCSAMATVSILPFAALYCTEGWGEEGLGEEDDEAAAMVLVACGVIVCETMLLVVAFFVSSVCMWMMGEGEGCWCGWVGRVATCLLQACAISLSVPDKGITKHHAVCATLYDS